MSGLPSSPCQINFSCNIWLKRGPSSRQWRKKHQAVEGFQYGVNVFMFHHQAAVEQQISYHSMVS